jgi:general secretion pathway protein G
VEILIVVIILGILAAIVIPQFTQASNDARESSLASDLQTVRSQLELYKVQHLEQYPGREGGAGEYDATMFVTQLTSRTNAAGEVMGEGDSAADFPYGPYLQKFPANAFVAGAAASQVTIGTADPAPADAGTGWYFNSSTGKFSASDSATHAGL